MLSGVLYKFALDKAYVVGKDIESASATPSTTNTYWQTQPQLQPAAAHAFGKLTSRCIASTGSGLLPD